MTSGVSLRQSARALGLTYNNFERKVRKLARHAGLLDRNLQARAAAQRSVGGQNPELRFQFDEFESYEGCWSTRPVTVPVLIEGRSRFHVSAAVGTIRPRGKKTERRQAKVERDERRFGRRQDESRLVCARVLEAGAALVRPGATVQIDSDRKHSYVTLIRKAFRGREVFHTRVSSKAPRGAGTRLFAINHTEAIYRDHLARLRRDSWTATKKRRFLELFLRAYQSLRNWVAPRFNGEDRSPGQLLGFAGRRLKLRELVRWRQDLGARSVDPFPGSGAAIAPG